MKTFLFILITIVLLDEVSCVIAPASLRKAAKKSFRKKPVINQDIYLENLSKTTYSTGYFNQTLDHFNYANSYPRNTTFKQRYIYSSAYWGGAKSLSNYYLSFFMFPRPNLLLLWK